MLNSKALTGGLIIVGLAVIASHFVLKAQIDKSNEYALFGLQSIVNGPSTPVSAAYLSQVGSHAAPKMYVQTTPNPTDQWEQGGGSSVTNTTGRWAA